MSSCLLYCGYWLEGLDYSHIDRQCIQYTLTEGFYPPALRSEVGPSAEEYIRTVPTGPFSTAFPQSPAPEHSPPEHCTPPPPHSSTSQIPGSFCHELLSPPAKMSDYVNPYTDTSLYVLEQRSICCPLSSDYTYDPQSLTILEPQSTACRWSQ